MCHVPLRSSDNTELFGCLCCPGFAANMPLALAPGNLTPSTLSQALTHCAAAFAGLTRSFLRVQSWEEQQGFKRGSHFLLPQLTKSTISQNLIVAA